MSYILILGGTSDIGKALAREYAKNGYALYLAARNTDVLVREVKDLMIRYQVDVQAVELDVLDYQKGREFYQTLDPKPIGVICVVGYTGDHKKAQDKFEEAEQIMATNYTACVNILNVIANDFEERGKGFIMGISSVAGDRGRQSNYIYGSAKAAYSAYLSGLRNRLARSGVQVLTIKPGYVNTKMTEGMDLPPIFTAEPSDVAEHVVKAQQKHKDVVYTKWYWRWIMLIIIHIPEKIFKRMKL